MKTFTGTASNEDKSPKQTVKLDIPSLPLTYEDRYELAYLTVFGQLPKWKRIVICQNDPDDERILAEFTSAVANLAESEITV